MTPRLVGYYRCERKKGRNAEFPIHVLMDFNLGWEEGALKSRGLLGHRRVEREMQPHEIEICDTHKRAQCYKYRSPAGLIEDERACGASEEFIKQLESAFSDLKEAT